MRVATSFALGIALLAGSATPPAHAESENRKGSDFSLIPREPLGDCPEESRRIDQLLAKAHATNAGVHRIEGFPYLRSDRFLASFRDEVPDGPKFQAWVARLLEQDLEARNSEVHNLGLEDPEEKLETLERCGGNWAAHDLADPARRAQLREAVAVPDDYSLLKRTLGLYPLTVPFLDLGMSSFNKGVRKDYARPLEQLDAPGPVTLWRAALGVIPAPRAADWLTQRDALGVPRLDAAQWRALAAAHLPSWQVETAGDFDRPGTVGLKDGEPDFDAARPLTYVAHGWTRFGHRVLAQLIYVVWFSQRPGTGVLNAYGGALDGIVWRVTLDEQGAPLLYDTVHPCGCYHYFFSARPLKRKAQGGFWDEPILFPQESVPAEPFAIRLASGTHFVRRLVPLAAVTVPGSDEHRYAMADYESLLSLPDGHGGTRSLFCESGLVCGTERRERLWLWPAGIESAGAMRQLGRHPTSFVGRSHFDDARMLERLFEWGRLTPTPLQQ